MKLGYIHDVNIYNTNAAEQLVPLLVRKFRPKSVIDVGCGLGTWLAIFQHEGVEEILGIDGDYVDKTLMSLDPQNFIERDLSKPFRLSKKYDLALSLEVAEHLSAVAADEFIKSLTSCSDTVIFSAAIPGQGGQRHINEQFPEYWMLKFAQYGFSLVEDFTEHWDNGKIDWWYLQNMVVYKKTNVSMKIGDERLKIHPELYKKKLQEIEDLKASRMNLVSGHIPIKQAIKILLKSLGYSLKK